MVVSFDSIEIGRKYTRPELAELWHCQGYQAISRGLVTPRNDTKIILFITEERRSGDTEYTNRLAESLLVIDGPKDHFAENRVLNSAKSGDEVHLFFRKLHRDAFTYFGQVKFASAEVHSSKPSRFVFRLSGG